MDKNLINLFKSLTDKQIKDDLMQANYWTSDEIDEIISLIRVLCDEEKAMALAMNLADECPGAVDPALMLMQFPLITELNFCLKNGIKGTDLYCLWNDCGKRDFNLFLENLWALESGVYKKYEIDENFKINHLESRKGWGGQTIFTDESEDWLDKNNRLCVRPFVYPHHVIDPNNYISDLQKVKSPKHPEFIKYVRANRTYQRFNSFLAQSRFEIKDYKLINTHDIEVKMIVPTITKNRWGDYGVVQDRNNPAETFVVSMDQVGEIIAEPNQNKHFDKMNRADYVRVLNFLRYAKRQFLPSLSVIRCFQTEEDVKNFYSNNNAVRFGELMKQTGFTNYEFQEGFVRLAYVLGLFSKSATESEEAFRFLNENVVGKIDGVVIHKLYGAIPTENGYNKDFARFFMINCKDNIYAFHDETGVDYTTQIYANFEKILKFRPEKEIETTTNYKRLTPSDAISAVKDPCCIMQIDGKFREKVKEILKYGAREDEIMWAVELLEQAMQIPKEEIHIPYIKDDLGHKCTFRVLEKGDPEIIYTGKRTNCCFVYNGLSMRSLVFAVTSPDSSVVVFESEKGYTQGWIWYDQKNKMLVVDNLEGRPERDKNGDMAHDITDAIIRFADKMIVALREKGLPCDEIRIGEDAPWAVKNTYNEYIEQGKMFKTFANLEFVEKRNLYTDAYSQLVISNDELLKQRGANMGQTCQNQPE